MFQKRHYEAIALSMQKALNQVSYGSEQYHGIWIAVDSLRETFLQDNSRFDVGRFERACVPGANVSARS